VLRTTVRSGNVKNNVKNKALGDDMTTISIFGGTGYAGGAIRDEALRRGHTVISGADYAKAFVDEIEKPEHRRQRFSVAY
jgi:putative NADH-flavin reductase